MLLRLVAVAVLAAWVAACSSDLSSINILPKMGSFESLSLGDAGVQTAEVRPVTAADLIGPQGQCAGPGRMPAQRRAELRCR
jgi:hypothetical protein